jgi:hypothetical protein
MDDALRVAQCHSETTLEDFVFIVDIHSYTENEYDGESARFTTKIDITMPLFPLNQSACITTLRRVFDHSNTVDCIAPIPLRAMQDWDGTYYLTFYKDAVENDSIDAVTEHINLLVKKWIDHVIDFDDGEITVILKANKSNENDESNDGSYEVTVSRNCPSVALRNVVRASGSELTPTAENEYKIMGRKKYVDQEQIANVRAGRFIKREHLVPGLVIVEDGTRAKKIVIESKDASKTVWTNLNTRLITRQTFLGDRDFHFIQKGEEDPFYVLLGYTIDST